MGLHSAAVFAVIVYQLGKRSKSMHSSFGASLTKACMTAAMCHSDADYATQLQLCPLEQMLIS